MAWLDRNPLVEFQGIEQLFDPIQIGRNLISWPYSKLAKWICWAGFLSRWGREILRPARVRERILLPVPEISPGGRTILGLPSRNRKGDPNIVAMLRDLRNQFHMRESIDVVVTEYGIANLKWRTIRERAQALIDIAHPDDREKLVEQGKEKKILFQDQIFLSGSAYSTLR